MDGCVLRRMYIRYVHAVCSVQVCTFTGMYCMHSVFRMRTEYCMYALPRYSILPTPYSLLHTPYSILHTPYSDHRQADTHHKRRSAGRVGKCGESRKQEAGMHASTMEMSEVSRCLSRCLAVSLSRCLAVLLSCCLAVSHPTPLFSSETPVLFSPVSLLSFAMAWTPSSYHGTAPPLYIHIYIYTYIHTHHLPCQRHPPPSPRKRAAAVGSGLIIPIISTD